ncbi:MAG: hypothetical protein F8N15_07925, partial [Methanobacterium sp.]|nr:hypothetical protein [Methanobacterium sp.]
MTAGTFLGAAADALLQPSYVAESRVLIIGPRPQPLTAEQARDFGGKIVSDLHLETDPAFNHSLRTARWWKTPPVDSVAFWIDTRIGGVSRGKDDDGTIGTRTGDPVIDHLWSPVQMAFLGRTSQ